MMNAYTEGAARGTMQLPILTRTLSTDVTGDFSLPDYQPEIKRLLRIEANVLPPQRFASATGVELGGNMDYYVLYMGHDNKLYCAPLSTEYHLEASPEGGERELMATVGEPMVCLCDAVADSPVGRVTAPRRLSIRCRVHAAVKLYGECPVDGGGATVGEHGEGDSARGSADDHETEILRGIAEIGRMWSGLGESVPLQDDIILPPGGGEMRVVCAEGRVLMTEATATEGGVICRGEAVVKLMLCPEEAEALSDMMGEANPETAQKGGEREPTLTILQRKIPFGTTVEMDGMDGAASGATARGFCTDLSVSMEEGHLHVELAVVCEARAQREERVSYIKDMYSTRRESVCRYTTLGAEKPGRIFCGNVTLSDSLALADVGLEPDMKILDVTATATPEELTVEQERGRCVLTGECRAHLLLSRDGECSSTDMTLPFRYEFEDASLLGDEGTSETHYDGCVTVVGGRARMDAERVGLDAELAISLRTVRSTPLTVLTEMSFGQEVTRRRGEYVVCFPASDDTLWSVAKRYHAPVAALVAANGLSEGEEETMEGVGYLIV